MKTPLAWLNLAHQRMRTLIAVAGITFAVVLIFLQLGFRGAVSNAATALLRELDFDLLVAAPQYVEVNRSGEFPRERLYQAQGVAGVASVSPLYIGFNFWYNPENRRRRNIMILGFKLGDPVFRFPEVSERLVALQAADTVLMDRLSRPEFQPRHAGADTEIGSRRITVVGQFALPTGFGADGALITSEDNFLRLVPRFVPGRVSLGLVKLSPGADFDEAARELRSVLSPAARVLTRESIVAQEERHWERNTSVGVIFGLGVVVALLVGTVFVYQVISSDITNRIAEYATLKAMGYPERYLSSVVLQQTVILALVGYVSGLLVSLGLYAFASAMAYIPIDMSVRRAVFVFLLALLMCALSGFLALRKARRADPADLF